MGVLESVVDRLKEKWPKDVATVSRSARAYWKKTSESAAKPLPPDCLPKAEPAKKAEPVTPTIPLLLPPAVAEEKKLSPQARAEKIQREKMRALSEFDAMLKKGEWGIIFQRLPEWAATLEESPCVAPAHVVKKEEEAPKVAKTLEDSGAGSLAGGVSNIVEEAPWKKVVGNLEKILDKSEKDAGGTEIAKLDGLRFRQEALRKRLDVFERHLRQMMQVYPFINPSILHRISEAGKAMEQATASLGKRRSSHAVPPEEEAIRKLAQGQNSMQQAMQQMAQRGSLGLGTPRGFGAMGPGRGGNRPWWSRNPNFPQPRGSNERGREEDGNLGTRFSEVLIPDREQYKVPAKYREEIMEAMKDGLPSGMRGEIENYFDRLTK